MQGIVLIIAVAIIVEALIEYGKTVAAAAEAGQWKTAVTQLVAGVLGMLLCFALGVDLFAVLGIRFLYGWVGVALTGIIVSRGSNYVSDFINRLTGEKEDE